MSIKKVLTMNNGCDVHL